MGRKKNKKNRCSHGSGHKRSVSNNEPGVSEAMDMVQVVEADIFTANPTSSDSGLGQRHPGSTTAIQKEGGHLGEAMAPVDAAVPGVSAKDRQSPSPPRPAIKNANAKPKPKTVRRAQMQGQLSGLEAELAVVENLQVRMAAKLSALDANLAEKEMKMKDEEAAEQMLAGDLEDKITALPSPSSDEIETAKPPKKKNKKKSKQDKSHKQQENIKEAQQIRDLMSSNQNAGKEKKDMSAFCPYGLCPAKVVGEAEPHAEKELPMQIVSPERTEQDVNENQESDNLIVEIDIKDPHDSDKDYCKSEMAVCSVLDGADYDMTKEVAKYLQLECSKMLEVQMAIEEEMKILPQMLECMDAGSNERGSNSPKQTPANMGHSFSYADAVKLNLKSEREDQGPKVALENEGTEFHERFAAAIEETQIDIEREQQTYLFRYMKNEYEPYVRKVEAEEAEIFYHEYLENNNEKEVEKLPWIEISLTRDVSSSIEEEASSISMKPDRDEESNAVLAAMEADYKPMLTLQHCSEAEIVYWETLVKKERSLQKPDKRSRGKTGNVEDLLKEPNEGFQIQNALEVANYLMDESSQLENLRAAQRGEEIYLENLHGGRANWPTDAARMTAMLEAATMEVEYDKVEQEYLLQREQQRQQPWRWVRADTAPAYINVPETVLEPTSDQEEDTDPQHSTSVQTDLAGLVFQCRDSSIQTDGLYVECCKCGQMALPWDQQFAQRLQEEAAQRMTLENMVRLLEAEAADLRQRLFQQRKFADELENLISDKKAEATEARLLAMEYKSRCLDLEHSLDTARSVVITLEEHVDTCQAQPSDLDFMLEAKINAMKAKECQGKVHELEAKLALSKSDVERLLDNISDSNDCGDLIPVLVHQKQLDQAESRCCQLQLRVTQLEAELAKVQNVRDVWGSNQEGSTGVERGSLEMGFQSLGSSSHQPAYTLRPSVLPKMPTSSVDLPPVDLPPVPGLHSGGAPGYFSDFRGLSSTPPGEGPGLGANIGDFQDQAGMDCRTLSSGLLSGLSDLQAKSTSQIVAPLAMQEDMDSDDDVSWSSASEHLKDIVHSSGQARDSSAPGMPLSPCFQSKSCLPHNSLHSQSVMLPACMTVTQQQNKSTGQVSHVRSRGVSPAAPVSPVSPHHVPPVIPVSPAPPVPSVSPHSMPACRSTSYSGPHQMLHLTDGLMVSGCTDQTNSPSKPKGNKKRNRSKKYAK